MCNRSELVPIPDFMRNDPHCVFEFDPNHPEFGLDEEGRDCFRLDACIVPALLALWAKGIKTTGCCCGHGSGSGIIGLLTEKDREGEHIMEAPPYNIAEVVERRRHENAAYERGLQRGYVDAGREDLWLKKVAP